MHSILIQRASIFVHQHIAIACTLHFLLPFRLCIVYDFLIWLDNPNLFSLVPRVFWQIESIIWCAELKSNNLFRTGLKIFTTPVLLFCCRFLEVLLSGLTSIRWPTAAHSAALEVEWVFCKVGKGFVCIVNWLLVGRFHLKSGIIQQEFCLSPTAICLQEVHLLGANFALFWSSEKF